MKYEMSFFHAPIAPQKAEGRTVAATLIPAATVTVDQVHQMIVANERLKELTRQVREATDMRRAKAALLPYVTPCGVFARRVGSALMKPSGLLPIDIDHLESPERAAELREALFADRYLQPVLCFVSPSGRGVKAFLPYPVEGAEGEVLVKRAAEFTRWAMAYTALMYGDGKEGKVDPAGKDLARACFLGSDEGARGRW